MSEKRTDLLGNPLSYTEQEILEIHARLERLLERGDLAPCIEMNTRHALAAMEQVAADLDLDYSPLGASAAG